MTVRRHVLERLFLTGGRVVRRPGWQRLWIFGTPKRQPGREMNRLYVAECSLTVTGSTFSHNQAIGGNNSSGAIRPGLGVGGAILSGGQPGLASSLDQAERHPPDRPPGDHVGAEVNEVTVEHSRVNNKNGILAGGASASVLRFSRKLLSPGVSFDSVFGRQLPCW